MDNHRNNKPPSQFWIRLKQTPFSIIAGSLLFGAFLFVNKRGEPLPSVTINYKMTVEINTPDGMQSGTGIYSFRYIDVPPWTGLNKMSHGPLKAYWDRKGTDTCVDLGEKGKLCIDRFEMRDSYTVATFKSAFPVRMPITTGGELAHYQNIPKGQVRYLKPKDYPLMIYKDLGEEKENCTRYQSPVGTKTRPCLREGNIQKELGEGYSVQSISIERIEKPENIQFVYKVQ